MMTADDAFAVREQVLITFFSPSSTCLHPAGTADAEPSAERARPPEAGRW